MIFRERNEETQIQLFCPTSCENTFHGIVFHEIMFTNVVCVCGYIHILIHNPIMWSFGVKSVVKSTISPYLSIPSFQFLSLALALILPFSVPPQAIKCIWFVNHIFIIFHLSLWFSSGCGAVQYFLHICTRAHARTHTHVSNIMCIHK